MNSEKDSQESLGALYKRAQELREQVNLLQSNSDAFKSKLESTISLFSSCKTASENGSIFSKNETLEDLATGDIQLLNIDYFLGELRSKTPTPDLSERKRVLTNALQDYSNFLERLDNYELFDAESTRLYERFKSGPLNFDVVASKDPAKRREHKIALFKREKQLKEKLTYLRNNERMIEHDEQDSRDLYLAEIAFHVHHTFQALDSIAQELRILASAPAEPLRNSPADLENDYRSRNGRTTDSYSERLDVHSLMAGRGRGGPLLDPKGKPLQPFTLLDRRQQLQDGVFRSGHRLPTMTIDEYLDEEMKRGGIIQGGEPPEKVIDEDDLVAADAETIKARAWDEFKEENPKGAGNTMNRG